MAIIFHGLGKLLFDVFKFFYRLSTCPGKPGYRFSAKENNQNQGDNSNLSRTNIFYKIHHTLIKYIARKIKKQYPNSYTKGAVSQFVPSQYSRLFVLVLKPMVPDLGFCGLCGVSQKARVGSPAMIDIPCPILIKRGEFFAI